MFLGLEYYFIVSIYFSQSCLFRVDIMKAEKNLVFLMSLLLCNKLFYFCFSVLHNARSIDCTNDSYKCIWFNWFKYSSIYFKLLCIIWCWYGDIESIYFIGSDITMLYDGICNGYDKSVKSNTQSSNIYIELVELASIHRHNDCLHNKR